MVREYKKISKDDEFKYLSEETKEDVALRSDKLAKENEANRKRQEMMRNNVVLYSEKDRLT